jgi:hypothetical protein
MASGPKRNITKPYIRATIVEVNTVMRLPPLQVRMLIDHPSVQGSDHAPVRADHAPARTDCRRSVANKPIANQVGVCA